MARNLQHDLTMNLIERWNQFCAETRERNAKRAEELAAEHRALCHDDGSECLDGCDKAPTATGLARMAQEDRARQDALMRAEVETHPVSCLCGACFIVARGVQG